MLSRRHLKVKLQLASLALLSVLLGLWLRFNAPISPPLRDGSGGVAYVLFFTLAIAAVSPTAGSAPIATGVLVVTCCLECLQLWHPSWLEWCRRTVPGRLLLGTTFEWTDFPPYFIGAAIGWGLLRRLRRN